jgi:hypothetical protein
MGDCRFFETKFFNPFSNSLIRSLDLGSSAGRFACCRTHRDLEVRTNAPYGTFVRNGEAGSPSRLKRFTSGTFAQP